MQEPLRQSWDTETMFRRHSCKVSSGPFSARRSLDGKWSIRKSQLLKIGQSSLSYIENRKQQKYVLYLKFLAENGVDLNIIFGGKDRVSLELKNQRQRKKIGWQKVCEFAGMSQGALSWIENREDTTFDGYLKVLVRHGVDIQGIFKS